MKYHKGTRRKTSEYEQDLVRYWKEHHTFEKSIAQRPSSDSYVFYDGPPFITGVPHHGTLLTSIVKDAVPRYQTMKGKHVERVWGWDCHGLPAEVFTEKKLGIQDRRDIGTKVTLEDYITTCRQNMVQTGSLWEDTIERIGRWVDFKQSYKTMDKPYMESVWWAFKQLYQAGKIYEGEKVLLYCTRDATPLSKAEVTMDNDSYKDVTDPSVYVKFKLKGEDTCLLAWTTTPWTLPANTAIAVGESFIYAEVKLTDGQRFILAQDLIPKVLINEKHQPISFTIERTLSGRDLVGKTYEPLFEDRGNNAHKVWAADYVSIEEGTGIVHLAPAYGEEDYMLAKENNFPIISNIDDSGYYLSGEWKGKHVWEINKQIAKSLHERGIVWKIEYIRHSYPHCYRCGTRLMYRAHPSWFLNISEQRERMLAQNSTINWFPEYLKQGRFAKTIETAPDWNLSRDRFWATAMPVWKGVSKDGSVRVKVVGSYAELKELSGVELEDYHRPWIDEVTFDIDGVHYQRIDKVIDCWFESGSMPFAQFHYPFENVEKFEQHFPGDFIVEYVAQTRAWFYYLHAVNVGLFNNAAFRNVIAHGTLAGNDGRKMSKSYGNYTDPNELMDKYGADALRFLLLSSPLLSGEDFSLLDKDVADVSRKLSMIWNMFDFFTLYAEVDQWEWQGDLSDPMEVLKNPLDIWIVSRLHQLMAEIDAHMAVYDIPEALKPVLLFVDDASNWYVRRSRRRFWKSGDDADKQQAYCTLHYVLVQLSMVLAPFIPFLSDELYRKLTGGESVHLLDWPRVGRIDQLTIDRMVFVRMVINDGLSQRAAGKFKVRQPLSEVHIVGDSALIEEIEEDYLELIKDELNVKKLVIISGPQTKVTLNTTLTPELIEEGMAREIVRNVQSARKQAGLEVSDRIILSLTSSADDLRNTIKAYRGVIAEETLASSIVSDQTFASSIECVIDGFPLTIALQKQA
jgi:isoleucyl-tRNA synthetase